MPTPRTQQAPSSEATRAARLAERGRSSVYLQSVLAREAKSVKFPMQKEQN